MTHEQQQDLVNAIQMLAPLVQRLAVTARQQQVDAEAALLAARRAVAVLDTVKTNNIVWGE